MLHVPNALLLAALAGIFDVLPLVGFFLFAIPAVAMALTVSPASAGLVGLLYLAYHLVENYFIVPKVYGNRLRLSTLTVLISCLAAGMVAGVVGVIIILPIVVFLPHRGTPLAAAIPRAGHAGETRGNRRQGAAAKDVTAEAPIRNFLASMSCGSATLRSK